MSTQTTHSVEFKPSGHSRWLFLQSFTGADSAGDAQRFVDAKVVAHPGATFRIV